jgi:hypothetical protein
VHRFTLWNEKRAEGDFFYYFEVLNLNLLEVTKPGKQVKSICVSTRQVKE